MIIKKLAARVHKTDENHKVYMVFVISFLCLITSHIKQSNKNLIFKIHLPLSVLAKKKKLKRVYSISNNFVKPGHPMEYYITVLTRM